MRCSQRRTVKAIIRHQCRLGRARSLAAEHVHCPTAALSSRLTDALTKPEPGRGAGPSLLLPSSITYGTRVGVVTTMAPCMQPRDRLSRRSVSIELVPFTLSSRNASRDGGTSLQNRGIFLNTEGGERHDINDQVVALAIEVQRRYTTCPGHLVSSSKGRIPR